MFYLEALKNQFVGKIHYPHGHMVDKGIQAVTIEAISSKKAASGSKDVQKDNMKISNMLALFERLLHGFDQVDEQLHAGDYLYVLVGPHKYVNNSTFIWPAALLILAYFLPALLEFVDYCEQHKENASKGGEALFIALIYSLGFILVFMPEGFASISGNNDFYKMSKREQSAIANQTFIFILVSCTALILSFNLFSSQKCDTLILKSINWFIVSVVNASLIVYAFPVVLINIAFIFPLLQNSVSLLGWNRQKGQAHYNKEWFASIVMFILWSLLFVSTLLGTVIFSKDSPSEKAETLKQMVATIITDYHCVGSNCWVYFCCLFVPNVLTII